MQEVYKKKVDGTPYQPNDWVLMRNMAKQKLDPVHLGPYRVIRATPLHTYQLAKPDGTLYPELVHHDRLRVATVEEVPKELWTKTNSRRNTRKKEASNKGTAGNKEGMMSRAVGGDAN